MRDPNRIKSMLQAISELWTRYPDSRRSDHEQLAREYEYTLLAIREYAAGMFTDAQQ